MASSSYTANLGLCNWTENDRPKRADFISDNGIIDSVLGGHVLDQSVHMSAAEKSKALTPFESFLYAGTGESSRSVAMTFQPSFAIVFKRNEAPVAYTGGVTVVNSGVAYYGHGGTAGVSIGTNSVVVQQEATAVNGRRVSLNEEDCQYTLIVFK